jgi:glutathione peroxidase
MLKIIAPVATLIISFFSYNLTLLNGGTLQLSNHAHKKILLVNIASGSPHANQVIELQQLQQQFADSLLVIAVPGNSFGNESKDSAALASWLYDSLHVSFAVTTPALVTGTAAHPLYAWLADASLNGGSSTVPTKDFQKFLLDQNGDLIGIFNSEVSPLAPAILQSIQSNP